MNARRLERTVFWLLPAGVLLVTFVGLCVMTGTAWPWNQVVHEDGSHTLLSTVFYVEHATRELIPDALLALAVAGAVRYYFPPLTKPGGPGSADASRQRMRLGLLAAGTLVGIVGGTLWIEGGRALIDNLAQFHTRAGAPLVWGAHWRYHLIERFAQIMLAFSVSGGIWLLHSKPAAHQVPGRFRFYGAALLLFAGLTVVFRLTADPFQDPAFLGHQLRELFTHSLVTFPLAMGTCLALARKYAASSGPWTLDSGLRTHLRAARYGGQALDSAWPMVVTGGAAVLSGAFLLVASVLADAQSHGQTAGLAGLLFPHFAEHALGYVFVPALAGVIYLAPARAGRGT